MASQADDLATADDIRAYQAERLRKGKRAATVNHEGKGLLRLLKRAKLLSRIRDDVKLLPVQRAPREMFTAGSDRAQAGFRHKPRHKGASRAG